MLITDPRLITLATAADMLGIRYETLVHLRRRYGIQTYSCKATPKRRYLLRRDIEWLRRASVCRRKSA